MIQFVECDRPEQVRCSECGQSIVCSDINQSLHRIKCTDSTENQHIRSALQTHGASEEFISAVLYLLQHEPSHPIAREVKKHYKQSTLTLTQLPHKNTSLDPLWAGEVSAEEYLSSLE